MESFIAVDVETACQDAASICQIGLVYFYEGAVEWRWSTLVDPECAFADFNSDLHGITADAVHDAPTWADVLDHIRPSLVGQTLVSHSSFDRRALHGAAQRYGMELPEVTWADSCAIARRTWPDLSDHTLPTLCAHLKIDLDHHNALSDAEACGRILLQGLHVSGQMLRDLAAGGAPPQRARAARRHGSAHEDDPVCAGVAGGPLAGVTAVLTGLFANGKRELGELAAGVGIDVARKMRADQPTIVVIGARDPAAFDGKEKSRKHLDAERAIEEGRDVVIMTEAQFRALLEQYAAEPAAV